MKIPTYLLLVFVLLLQACDGAGQVCPDIFVPVYRVTVYDSVTGTQLCVDQRGLSGDGNCTVTYTYTDNSSHADITVSLPNYVDHTEKNVANKTGISGCFSDPNYTTDVEVFLVPK